MVAVIHFKTCINSQILSLLKETLFSIHKAMDGHVVAERPPGTHVRVLSPAMWLG